MKGDLNQANIFRHFADKTTIAKKIDKADLPAWVKKAKSGFKEPSGKSVEKAQRMRKVPENLKVPNWKGRGKNKLKARK